MFIFLDMILTTMTTVLPSLLDLSTGISGGEGSLANEQLLRPAHSVPRDREEVQWWLPRRVRLLCCHRHLQAQGENIVDEDLDQS